MRRTILVRAPAKAELKTAVAWYERNKKGLGREFAIAVKSLLDRIAETPDRHPIVAEDVREAAMIRFPYCIYYRIRSRSVVVVAIYHQSRDSSGWQGRN